MHTLIAPPVGSKSSFISPSNIALIKYWGKRDVALNLPFNSSISMTLNALLTHTTVELEKILPNSEIAHDTLIVNQKKIGDLSKIKAVKKAWQIEHWQLKIESHNNFPTATGLASSASGISAFVGSMWGLSSADWGTSSLQHLSQIARIGSGSASRSFFGPFAIWHKGLFADGSDSHAVSLPYHPDLAHLQLTVVVVSSQEKEIPSTLGMQKTVNANKDYPRWVDYAEKCIPQMQELLKMGDIARIGTLAEENALAMHATTLPAYGYFLPQTWDVIRGIQNWREQTGANAFCTMDAGPNVKIISDAHTADEIKKWADQKGWHTLRSGLGNCATPTQQHLF